jgi:hypothetical protein
VSGFEEPGPPADWAAFRAARDRFFARVRPDAVEGAFVSPPADGPEAVRPGPAPAAATPAAGTEAA